MNFKNSVDIGLLGHLLMNNETIFSSVTHITMTLIQIFLGSFNIHSILLENRFNCFLTIKTVFKETTRRTCEVG